MLVLALDVLLAIAIGDAPRRDPALPATALAEAAFELAFIVAAAALPAQLHGGKAFRAHAGPRLAVAIACPLLSLLAVAARIDQVHFDRHTYAPFDPTCAWIDASFEALSAGTARTGRRFRRPPAPGRRP